MRFPLSSRTAPYAIALATALLLATAPASVAAQEDVSTDEPVEDASSSRRTIRSPSMPGR